MLDEFNNVAPKIQPDSDTQKWVAKAKQPMQLTQAVISKDVNAVKIMLENGADINERYVYGMTPLYLAVCYGHTEMVRLLVDHGARLDVMPYLNETTIDFARKKGFTEIVEILKDAQDRPKRLAEEKGRLARENAAAEIEKLIRTTATRRRERLLQNRGSSIKIIR